jgi:hypothetical protein
MTRLVEQRPLHEQETTLIFDGMCHDWQLYAPMLDEGMASIEEYAAFIKAHQA